MATVTAMPMSFGASAKTVPAKKKRREFVTGLVMGGQIVAKNADGSARPTNLTTLSQTRKPPSMAALGRARGVAPFLVRSF